ncbi:MAG: hypothetical protein E5X51_19940 [Mesorhizobium sp.]|nr:MAG: hypothetical protein E5X51_19940 [Mesorhizobium sp.]
MGFGSISRREELARHYRRDRASSHDFTAAGCRQASAKRTQGTNPMDIVVLGAGFLFFALFFAFVKACDSL